MTLEKADEEKQKGEEIERGRERDSERGNKYIETNEGCVGFVCTLGVMSL